jgi:hypothetical protein
MAAGRSLVIATKADRANYPLLLGPVFEPRYHYLLHDLPLKNCRIYANLAKDVRWIHADCQAYLYGNSVNATRSWENRTNLKQWWKSRSVPWIKRRLKKCTDGAVQQRLHQLNTCVIGGWTRAVQTFPPDKSGPLDRGLRMTNGIGGRYASLQLSWDCLAFAQDEIKAWHGNKCARSRARRALSRLRNGPDLKMNLAFIASVLRRDDTTWDVGS